MNDPHDPQRPLTAEELVDRLGEADPADAPALAEQLADRLATELDSTDGRPGPDTEQSS